MTNIAQSNLAIIGLDKVFWKGKQLEGIKTIELKKASHHMECKLVIIKGLNDSVVLTEIRDSGIIVKEVK